MAVMGLNILSIVWPLCVVAYALIKEDQPLEAEVPFFFEEAETSDLESKSSMQKVSPGVFKDRKDPALHMIKVAPGVFKPYRTDKNDSDEGFAPASLLQLSSETDDAASTESETGLGRLRSLVTRTVDKIKKRHAEQQKLTEARRAERDKASLKAVAEFGQKSLDKLGELSRDLSKQNRVRDAFSQVQRRQRKRANLKASRARVAKAALQKLQERKAQTTFSRNMVAQYAGFLNRNQPWYDKGARREYLKNMVTGLHQEMKRAKTQHKAGTADGETEASSADDFQEKAETPEDIEQEVEPEAPEGEAEREVVEEELDDQQEEMDSPQSDGTAQTL